VISALLWPQQIAASNSKIFRQRKDDEEALQKLSFDQIEQEFRIRVSVLSDFIHKLSFDQIEQ
jgi:hypothetical protein